MFDFYLGAAVSSFILGILIKDDKGMRLTALLSSGIFILLIGFDYLLERLFT